MPRATWNGLALEQQRRDGEAFDQVALVDAARRGDLADVEWLLTTSVNVNAGGEGLMLTALQAAVLAKSLPVTKALLDAGANPNTPSSLLSGTGVGLPLDYAVEHNLDAIALWLLEHGARANAGQVLAKAVSLRNLASKKGQKAILAVLIAARNALR